MTCLHVNVTLVHYESELHNMTLQNETNSISIALPLKSVNSKK